MLTESCLTTSLGSETIQSTSRPFEGVDNVEGSYSFTVKTQGIGITTMADDYNEGRMRMEWMKDVYDTYRLACSV